MSLAQARRQALDLTIQRDAGRPIHTKDSDGLTIEELVAKYVDSLRNLGRGYASEVERALNHDLVAKHGRRRANEAGKRELIDLLNEVSRERDAPIMSNRLRQYIRGLYRWATAEDLIETDPSTGIRPRASEMPCDRSLSTDEIRSLWIGLSSCPISQPMASLLKFKLLTGKRTRELTLARWENIDGDWWTAPPSTTKTGQPHRFPISPLLRAEIAALKSYIGPADHLFPSPAGDRPIRIDSVSRAVARIRRSIDLPHWTAKDLRRTVATQMGELGISPDILRRVLNHADNSVTAIYNRYDYAEEIRAAVLTWHTSLSRIVE